MFYSLEFYLGSVVVFDAGDDDDGISISISSCRNEDAAEAAGISLGVADDPAEVFNPKRRCSFFMRLLLLVLLKKRRFDFSFELDTEFEIEFESGDAK